MTNESVTAADGVERIVGWVKANLGADVTGIDRQPRWRPMWWVDADRDGEHLELCVRGDRVDTTLVFPLDHEMRLQALMHDHGIPVPAVHGWIDEPAPGVSAAYVMDRVGGRADFAQASDAQRDSVIDEYLQTLARLHALPIQPFIDGGIMRAPTPADSGVLGMARFEATWRAMKKLPDPFLEFSLGWLRRNPPVSHGREAAIVWDSGQLHHADGRLVAVIDVEIGHIGDPMMDLAAWRQRDTVIGFGDMAKLYDRYGELSGEPVDLDALMRHHFGFCLTNQLSFGPVTRVPTPGSDLMTNLQWCYETNLFATEALAEILDVELPTVDVPAPSESRSSVVIEHLVRGLGSVTTDDEYLRYQIRTMFRMARHAARLGEIGDELDRGDLDDLHSLLGHRPESWIEGEAELERFVLANADNHRFDEALLTLFHRRHLRAHMSLGPAGSAMTRHGRIQTFR